MSRIGSHHAEWLELLEISGPFLSLPVLERAFPQGLDVLDSSDAKRVRLAHDEWVDEQQQSRPDPGVHDAWIRFVLHDTLELTDDLLGDVSRIASDFTIQVPEHDATLRPDFVVQGPDGVGGTTASLLIQSFPPMQDLDGIVTDSDWAASPATRMALLCRAVGVRLGMVTNGERWLLVHAAHGQAATFVSWYASLWSQEPLTLRAFRSLVGARRFFGVEQSDTLDGLLAESATYQAEVTEQLGAQVRRAVEVLVQALDRADADSGHRLLNEVSEDGLYEAALIVMMRLVFLFFAEENGLLPLADELYQQSYAASTLRGHLRETADQVGIEVLERRQDAWSRLLATFRAIHGGIDHEALRLPPYGGSLFDPDRFPFLEGRTEGTTWRETAAQPLPVDNRTVLHLLDALQILRMRSTTGTEARKLSFRALDIEQIGHVYETLLDHRVLRADGLLLGLVGSDEPEIPLDELEERKSRLGTALLDFIADQTGKSRSAVDRALVKRVEVEWEERIRMACGDDANLTQRVMPFHAVIRSDPWGEPIVIRAGSVFVTAGSERRATGTYYTPRALTEETVTQALEPLAYQGASEGLPRGAWRLKPANELLGLKVCDPAMGSGAFLVQVVRWLSERVVEAWDAAEGSVGRAITAEGNPADSARAELGVPTDPEDRRALARRLVADRCVYGVDINPLAVEMAKLSLWLVTLGKGLPFSFLDHALKCGDSLLGVVDIDQIRQFHLDSERGSRTQPTLFDPRNEIKPIVTEAARIRIELERFTVIDVRDAEAKATLNDKAMHLLDQLRGVGDLLTAAALSSATRGEAGLDSRLRSLSGDVAAALRHPSGAGTSLLRTDLQATLNAGKPPSKQDRRPFHWPVEFPEVFERDRPGFDSMVGNPPFRGGKKISGTLGSDYRAYLVAHVAGGQRGNADLVAYFFLRAAEVVRKNGTIGLLATNTISQGDTREVALDQLAAADWTISRAWKSRPWPGDATVEIAQVWLYNGEWRGTVSLDGSAVQGITPTLDPRSRTSGAPFRLAANAGGAFIGSFVNGIGFVLDPAEAQELIEHDPRNRDVLFPYMNGADLNSDPTHSPKRWVINFFDWPLELAEQYPECLAVVRQRVKPQRDLLPDYKRRVREEWWKFEYVGASLYRTIQGLRRVIAIARISRTAQPVFVPTGLVFNEKTVVFPHADDSYFGLLSSCVHYAWAVKYSSTLRKDLQYTPTDCFETFPHPDGLDGVGDVASLLDKHRYNLMGERREGLTKTYNRLNDPRESSGDIARLRDLHAELDGAVVSAYGWVDLELDHGFHETAQGLRYTVGVDARVEILDRLLEINHARHDAEQQALELRTRR